MSLSPAPPGRALLKNRRCSSSDSSGPTSENVELRTATFTGVSQGQSAQSRCETQMSLFPTPPTRLDAKKRLRPSLEMAAWLSIAVELITGPRFTGADHSELAKNMAWMPYTISSDSGPQGNQRHRAQHAGPAFCVRNSHLARGSVPCPEGLARRNQASLKDARLWPSRRFNARIRGKISPRWCLSLLSRTARRPRACDRRRGEGGVGRRRRSRLHDKGGGPGAGRRSNTRRPARRAPPVAARVEGCRDVRGHPESSVGVPLYVVEPHHRRGRGEGTDAAYPDCRRQRV